MVSLVTEWNVDAGLMMKVMYYKMTSKAPDGCAQLVLGNGGPQQEGHYSLVGAALTTSML